MAMIEEETALHEPLLLPDVERTSLEIGYSSMYGAAALAASYCGLKRPPRTMRGSWQHGWYPSHWPSVDPEMMLGHTAPKDAYYWVARQDEEARMRSFGYDHVKAIGLPVVYLRPRSIERKPGSLLVMPVHSLDCTSHSWKFDEYAEAIASIRADFSEVVVCIHPVCWKHGYWVDAFRKLGFPLVSGALVNDRNALERVRYLMSRFEYVTTNCHGSHLAYAAYFGARPSVYGPYARFYKEDFKNDPLYRRNPRILEPTLEALSEEELRRNCPQFFCHPREAKADVAWGRFEVGESNKVAPRTMRSLFQWTVPARVTHSLASKTPDRVKRWARMLSDPTFREQRRETQRLWALSGSQPTRTNLLGPSLEVLDAHHFMEARLALFEQEVYRFLADREDPRILDCGASIGLSVCYFKKLYPKSEVLAFEPDPARFEILRRNCASWGGGEVNLIPKAVWTCETTLAFLRHDNAPGRIAETAAGEDVLRVPTCRLRDYLAHTVDLVRLNIEGAEVDVLLDCADLLGQVRNLAVEYHSVYNRPQRLDTLIGLLTQAGFRMHFRALPDSPSPFLYRTVRGGMDSRLHIWAFRE